MYLLANKGGSCKSFIPLRRERGCLNCHFERKWATLSRTEALLACYTNEDSYSLDKFLNGDLIAIS